MDKLKIVLTLVAVMLVALAVLATIGFLQYLFFFGLIALAAIIVVRILMKPGQKQIDAPDPKVELRRVDRTLEEYRRKLR